MNTTTHFLQDIKATIVVTDRALGPGVNKHWHASSSKFTFSTSLLVANIPTALATKSGHVQESVQHISNRRHPRWQYVQSSTAIQGSTHSTATDRVVEASYLMWPLTVGIMNIYSVFMIL